MVRRLAVVAVVFVAGVVVGGGTILAAGDAARVAVDVLLRTTTRDLRAPRTNVRAQVQTWDPGAETGRHHHAGPTLVYVLEGELEEKTPAGTRVIKAGEVVWDPAQHEHNIVNRTAHPARAFAVHLDPGR